MRERLIDLIGTFCKRENVLLFNRKVLDKFADYLFADGWIRPPCRAGDKVYIIRNGRVNEVWVRHTNWTEVLGMVDTFTFTVFYKSSPTSFTETLKFGKSEIGINVFLTKEEAEAVLRKEDKGK